MALQLSLITDSGMSATQAYIRIVEYTGDMNNMMVRYVIHADHQARIDNREPIDEGYLTIPAPDSDSITNMIEWCYEQVKLLPTYSGAIDV